MARRVSRRYPWGTQAPTSRIRDLSSKLTSAIADAEKGEFLDIRERAVGAVQAAAGLVQVVDHLAGAGLRVVGTEATPLPSTEVSTAVVEVREAVAALRGANVGTVSEVFRAFADAATRLIAVADTATKQGIEGTGESPDDDPFDYFHG